MDNLSVIVGIVLVTHIQISASHHIHYCITNNHENSLCTTVNTYPFGLNVIKKVERLWPDNSQACKLRTCLS